MSIIISKKQRNTIISFIVLVALVIGWFIAWNNGIRDYCFPKRWGTVREGLFYRSGRFSPNLIEETLQNIILKQL